MDKIDKVFYINLSSKHERNNHTLQQLETQNIPQEKIERFEAINGLTHNFNSKELNLFRNVEFLNYTIMPSDTFKKIMGNQLSHYYILNIMKERGYQNIIILQDDIILKNDFLYYLSRIMNDLPSDAEIINFGLHEFADQEMFIPYDLVNNDKNEQLLEKQITDFVYLYKTFNPETCHRINFTSLAYIVTKKGCENYIEYINNNGFFYPTDWNYNLYLQEKKIFYGSKYILATGNNNFKSDIFCNSDDLKMEQLIDTRFFYTDKNTTHSYFEIYEQIFNPYKKVFKNILEIGIGNFYGGSIILWNLYFKNAIIHAVDVVDEKKVYNILKNNKNKKNINLHLETDPYDINFINNTFKDTKLDLVIDDGPHTFESNCKCIELYSPLLSENGILVIEDVQNYEWIKQFIRITPFYLKKHIRVYDLRHIKNRYDDILFVINKNEKIF
jgi:GR25 family glycosyltransferase involved in LPS biosynthesis